MHPSDIYSSSNPESPKSKGVNRFKKAADLCKKHEMACLLEIHKTNSRPIPDYVTEKYITFMGALAKELSSTDPEYTFLEIINEPTWPSRDAYEWWSHQEKIAKAMREGAPQHTIALNGSQCMIDSSWRGGRLHVNWDQLDILVETMTMPKDIDNVIVSTHYYRPMTFTHQGASWVAFFGEIKGVSYPADTVNVRLAQNRTSHPDAKSNLEDYLKIGWDRDVFFQKFARAAEWRAKNGNPHVTIGEFGCQGGKGKTQYYHDIVDAMENYGFSWSNWWGGGSDLRLDQPLDPYDPTKGNPDIVIASGKPWTIANKSISPATMLLIPGSAWGRNLNTAGSVFTLLGRHVVPAEYEHFLGMGRFSGSGAVNAFVFRPGIIE
jgi:hypothetical protein